ncbi:MAG: GLUG motif-containing protein, partial [Rikenellaceae bacterium]
SCAVDPTDHLSDYDYSGESMAIYVDVSTNSTETKTLFTDNDSEGIAITWEVDDLFTIFDEGGALVGNYICTVADGSRGTFKLVADGLTLIDGQTYTAVYPATTEETLEKAKAVDLTDGQNGDEINNLANTCSMEGTFTYSYDSSIALSFSHNLAIMTLKFESDEMPSKLIFEDGDDYSYEVVYSEITKDEDTGIYTSHIMINPHEVTQARTLTFSLYAEEESEAYDVRSVESSVSYYKGYRYTAPVSDLWSGSGTEDDPYKISTATHLSLLTNYVAAGKTFAGEYFSMTSDIDLGGIDDNGNVVSSNEWSPIGRMTNFYFSGIFNGCGYKISGLYINASGTDGYPIYDENKTSDVIDNFSGSGTSQSPYLLEDADDLIQLSRMMMLGYDTDGLYFELTNNVDLNGSEDNQWTLIGSSTNSFKGVFDGGGYEVSNIYVNTTSNEQGFFGRVEGGEIKNLGVSGNISGALKVGGVVGYLISSSVTNCYNKAIVTGSGSFVGGITGYAESASVASCYNRTAVVGDAYVGGIVGWLYSSSTISNCYNTGVVTSSPTTYPVGGICGSCEKGTTITDSYWLDSSDVNGGLKTMNLGDVDITVKVESEMKNNFDFVTLLNSTQSPSVWKYDYTPVNDGYPILTWQ